MITSPLQTKAQNSKLRSGQALVVIALMMSVLILFLGLGVDAGNMMGKAAKLQSAVDAAALSAAQELSGGGAVTTTAEMKAFQILEANGVASNTLNSKRVDFPNGSNQVHVIAVQNVNTYFMRIIPMWRVVQVKAEATADLNSYAEMTTKPYGKAGVVNELNMMVWGVDSWRRGGDAYSPAFGASTGYAPNPEHPQQPYGYLFRIDVPPGYSSDHLLVQLFDPDTYNRPGAPPAWPTCSPSPCTTPTPTADQYASCRIPPSGNCSSNSQPYDTAMNLNAFSSGRPAFWRVDELRSPYTDTSGTIQNVYNAGYATTTQFTLWHFNPRITTAFGDPATLSDQPSGGYLARYTVGWDATTDLSWYRPSGFDIVLRDTFGDKFTRESNGGMYFYLYIQGIAGSSENNYDIRVGPPELNSAQLCTTPCAVNQQYLDNANNPTSYPDWQDGGANIFAKRALPLNLVTGVSFPLVFTQVSKNAAGQTLRVRHFDQDCGTGTAPPCGTTMQYQMQKCIVGCNPNSTDPNCWQNLSVGYVSGNNAWTDGVHPDKENVTIPPEGSAEYNLLFGNSGECPTSWLRIQSIPSYTGDTTVWEMPYIRPRLIK